MPPPSASCLVVPPVAIRDRDPSDPAFKSVELAQRGRMVLDVATADLAAAEQHLGAFHETTWHFRNALAEAKRSWERLRAEYGTRALETALAEPPLTTMVLGGEARGRARVVLIAIAGKTFRAEPIDVTSLEHARVMWRLTHLPASDDGPYYVASLDDRSQRCDCAEWVYTVAEIEGAPPCKHIRALGSLGWI